MKRAAAIGGFVFLVHVLALGTFRVSLLLMLIAGSSVLIWTVRRRPEWFWRRLATASVLASLLAIVPVDVRFHRTGRLGTRVLPIVWGLPTAATFERAVAREVILGGCILPLNPPAHIVAVSF